MNENNEILDEGFIELVGTIFSKPRKLTKDELKAIGIEVIDVTEADIKKAKVNNIDLDKVTHPTKVISDTVVSKLSNKFNIKPENVKRALALSGIVLVTTGTLSMINKVKEVKAKKDIKALELTNEEYYAIVENRVETLTEEIIHEDSLGKVLLDLVKDATIDALKSIGAFILANLIFVAIIIISASIFVKINDSNRASMRKYLYNNPKVRKYLNMILVNLRKFLEANAPSEFKKYLKFYNKLDIIDSTDKPIYGYGSKGFSGNKFFISLADIDYEKLFKDIYGKSIEDEFENIFGYSYGDQSAEKYNTDDFLDPIDYPEYLKVMEDIENWIGNINKKVKQYKNCSISFKCHGYHELDTEANDDCIMAVLKIKDIKNLDLSEEEKNVITKITGEKYIK